MSTLSSITSSTLSGVSTSSTTSTSTSTSSSSADASTAYTTFLTLLTTQLQNQDPLNATDPNQFTSELIQLASLEQQTSTSASMSSLVSSMSSLTAANGIGYIGKTIEAPTSVAPLQDGSADWNYTLSSDAASVTLTVTDSSGDTVYTGSGDTGSGKHSFTWDGTENSGSAATSGTYTLSVSALDSSGSQVTSSVTSLGEVTGVDSSNGTAELDMGGVEVALDSVLSVAA